MRKILTSLVVGPASVVATERHIIDYEDVRADIRKVMNAPSWDDGSYAPLLIRLAWHSSATYNHTDGTGGSNGATMRFAAEAADPNNAGLEVARSLLEPIQAKHNGLTHADLWILASYVALEMTNGPKLEFVGGRIDAEEGKGFPGRLPGAETGLEPGMNVDSQGRLKGWENLAQHVRDVFERLGFNERETVALISGGHAYGRCHREFTGYEGTWMENPLYFSNEYAKDMLADEWLAVSGDTLLSNGGLAPNDIRPSSAVRQYIDLTSIDPTALLASGMRNDDRDQASVMAAGLTPGQYTVTTSWLNVRQTSETGSPLINRLTTNQNVSFIHVEAVGKAVRGLAVQGGWSSIVGSSGSSLFERTGDLDMQTLAGDYRMIQASPAAIYAGADKNSVQVAKMNAGQEFTCQQMHVDSDGSVYGQLSTGNWVEVFSEERGLIAEKKVLGYNDQERRVPIKDQVGHQMMLVSDMVLRWDLDFKQHLEIFGADGGSEILSQEFGMAFKKLTELGHPKNSVVV